MNVFHIRNGRIDAQPVFRRMRDGMPVILDVLLHSLIETSAGFVTPNAMRRAQHVLYARQPVYDVVDTRRIYFSMVITYPALARSAFAGSCSPKRSVSA